MFGQTPLNQPHVNQPVDAFIKSLSCVAEIFKDSLNVGIMDYRESEKVYELYDM